MGEKTKKLQERKTFVLLSICDCENQIADIKKQKKELEAKIEAIKTTQKNFESELESINKELLSMED